MFSKLSVVASVLMTLAAAIPNVIPPVTPPTVPMCCASVVSSTSSPVSAVATLLGIDITDLPNVPIGLNCSPITVIGNNCGGVLVNCDPPDAEWGGLIAINCIPITL
ncbi:Hydrophobin 2 [Mycena venus]|uniref:Hydrophobin n=1 Tax=Mycena venus TaxID=2733690 RepID=A0A8H7CSM8_9AGAR|nr:Hydrophobin 2 [Mycena venus]